MIRVRVFNVADAVFIDSVRSALIAGTLIATSDGDAITIATINSTESLAAGPYTIFARQDGSGFADAPTCLAYMQATCGQVLQRVPTVTGVSGDEIAAGMPLARSRTDGSLRVARADTYALTFLAGLAASAVAPGFPLEATRTSVTLDDWTPILGQAALAQGQRYFLAPSGGIVAAPALTPGIGLCVAAVGYAGSPTTLVFQPTDPITL